MNLAVTENYLKAVYNTSEWSQTPVTVSSLASRLGLSVSSASEHVRKLTDRGLLTHAPYGAIDLTDAGRRIALRTVRKHRLVESFLVDYLGYSWDEVHDEAEILEHAVSELFVERLAQRLRNPTHDPHGDPIPGADGSLPLEKHQPLTTVEAGTEVRVVRVSDQPELLRQLDELGISINQRLTVVSRHDTLGTLSVDVAGSVATVGLIAATMIRVIPVVH